MPNIIVNMEKPDFIVNGDALVIVGRFYFLKLLNITFAKTFITLSGVYFCDLSTSSLLINSFKAC